MPILSSRGGTSAKGYGLTSVGKKFFGGDLTPGAQPAATEEFTGPGSPVTQTITTS
jgi:hypothetical protein